MTLTTFSMAYAMATSAGLRPFQTLLLASIAMHFGILHPAHVFASLGSDGATLILAFLALLECVADKLPIVDHAMHLFHFATKPIAAALIVGSSLSATGLPDIVIDLAACIGAANGLAIHSGVAALRGVSTATTFGIANPLISLAEDLCALLVSLFALFLPIVGAVIAIGMTTAIFFFVRWIRGMADSLRGSPIRSA